MEKSETKASDWSVKQPNEINLVLQQNVKLDSPCSTTSSKVLSRKSQTISTKSNANAAQVSNRLSNIKQSSPKRKKKPQIKQPARSGFFQFSQTDGRIRAPSLPASTTNKRQNARNLENIRTQEEFNNSHLPAKALNYLQMVDEPGVEKVIEQFSRHSFQDQFRKPLRQQQKTLFLSQVRDQAKLPEVAVSANCPDIQFHHQQKGWRATSRNKVKRESTLSNTMEMSLQHTSSPSPSGLASRDPLEDTRARPFHDGSIATAASQGKNYVKKGRSISFVPAVHANAGSIQVLQDSIESVMGPTFGSQMNASNLDQESQMKVKELWYYNIDRVNYRPYFHERIDEQMKRKQKFMNRQHENHHNSIFTTQNSAQVNITEPTVRESLQPGEHQQISSVIGSAFKVRDVDNLKLQHLRRSNYDKKQPHTTKNASKLKIKENLCEIKNDPMSNQTSSVHQEPFNSPNDDQSGGKQTKEQIRECATHSNVMMKNQSVQKNRSNTQLAKTTTNQSEIDKDGKFKLNQDTQTVLLQSQSRVKNDNDSYAQSPLPQNQNSLQLSNSASARDQSLMAIPMNSKISSEEASPLNPERNLAAKSHLSAKIGQESLEMAKTSKLRGGKVLLDVKDQASQVQTLAAQKILVSGSMTIRTSTDKIKAQKNQSKPSEASKPAAANNSDYNPESSGGVRVIGSPLKKQPEAEDKGLKTEELSMKNLNKNKSQRASEKRQSKKASDRSLPQENIEEPQNVPLAVIEQPKAHVRTSQEYVLARDSQADYEEFRQHGIISTKFSSLKDQSHRDSQSVGAPLEAKGVGTAKNTTDGGETAGQYGLDSSSQDPKTLLLERSQGQDTAEFDKQTRLVQASSHTVNHQENHNSRVLKSKIQKLQREGADLFNAKNADLIKAYYESLERAKQPLEDVSPEYIITQYSLPKALQRTVRSTQQSRRTRALSQQADRDQNNVLKRAQQQADDQEIEDVEQFTYEREHKQMLTGPPGRKLSKPMACRLQHHLNKRRTIVHHRMSDYIVPTKKQVQQPQELVSEVSFREPPPKKKTLSSTEHTSTVTQSLAYAQAMKCQGKNFEAKPMPKSKFHERARNLKYNKKKNQSIATRGPNSSSISKTDKSIADKSNLDLAQAYDSSAYKSNASSRERTSQVPRLQLNKVELQLFGNDYQASGSGGSGGQQMTPMLYGPPRLNPWHAGYGNQRVQHITTFMNPLNNDTSTRTTKMISIDVQTEAKRQQDKIRASKLNIVTQEKSVQDTLYDTMNGGMGSQKWMISNAVISNAGTEDGPFVNKTHDKVQVMDSKQEEDYVEAKDRKNDSKDGNGAMQPQFDDPDMVNTGDHEDNGSPQQKTQDQKMLSVTPGTILVSREGLGDQYKQPTSESAIAPAINVCDSRRSDAVRQRSQVFPPKNSETKYFEEQRSTARAAGNEPRENEEFEATPPSENQPSATMPNKYNPLSSETPNLDTSQKENSLRTLHSRNQYSKLNQDLPKKMPARELNVIVKTSSKPVNIVSKTQVASNHVRETTPSDESHAFQHQRARFYITNKDTPNETQMARLRYSSDREGAVSSSSRHKSTRIQRQTIQTIQTNSLGVDDKGDLNKKLRGSKANESYNSSEYVSLKLKNMDPAVQGIKQEQLSNKQLRASMEKTAIYKLKAMYGSPITELRNKATQERRNRNRLSQQSRERAESICSQRTKTKSRVSSVETSKESSSASRNQSPLQKYQQDIDPHWLEKYMQLKNLQHRRQNDRQQHLARQERILLSKTAHLSKQTSRERTPPISRNKLLQVPQKPHNRAKVSSIGNKHAIVEQIWAKTRQNLATMSPRRSGPAERLHSQ